MYGLVWDYNNEIVLCEKCKHYALASEFQVKELSDEVHVQITCPKCFYKNKMHCSDLGELIKKAEEKRGYSRAYLERHRGLRTQEDKQSLENLKKAVLPHKHWDITAVLREIVVNGEVYIGLFIRGQLIWKERRSWGYYWRFKEIGDALVEVLGSDIRDLVPDVHKFTLHGDSSASFDIIEKTRRDMVKNYYEKHKDY